MGLADNRKKRAKRYGEKEDRFIIFAKGSAEEI
jgi:hypothetical protein